MGQYSIKVSLDRYLENLVCVESCLCCVMLLRHRRWEEMINLLTVGEHVLCPQASL
jgi:hypothetical protein